MATHGTVGKGAMKFCPNCQDVVETRVMEEFNENVQVAGLHAKRRKVICGIDRDGTKGCGHTWFTLDVIETDLKLKLGIQD